MTATKKIFAVSLAFALLATNIYAQEDDWAEDSWGDEGSSSTESSEPSFWDSFKINGDANLAGRIYFDGSTGYNTSAKAIPSLKLGLDYDGASTKFSSKIKLDEQTLKYDNEMILDEFSADLFIGDFVLSAGKMKVVWGKGDKLHVLDNFNSNNYYDFLIPDYLDRRNGEYMFRAQYNSPLGFRVEGIYTPIMHGDTYASSGVWEPRQMTSLTNTVKTIKASQILAKAGSSGSLNQASLAALMAASSTSADSLYPDTFQLQYGQFGGYVNFTLGTVDLGVSYYNGHYKSVSVNGQAYAESQLYKRLGLTNSFSDISLKYDKLQAFGLDMQTAIGPFTVRAEAVYNMTKDFSGDDPWTKNNSIGYLFGFDVGLPIHNLNLNFQGTGNVLLKHAACVKVPVYGAIPGTYTNDVDYDPTGCYTNHKLVLQLKDTFYYEKVTALVKAIYGIERYDLVLMPELSFKIRDGWKITGSGLFIHNFDKDENSEFYGWLDNSFVQLAVNYTF